MSDTENTVENFAPGKNGGRLRVGNPGNKGGGRQPEWFKELCRAMVSSPKARAAAKAILEDASHPQFASMWKAVSERGYGKLDQAITVTTKPYREAVDAVRQEAGLRLVG